MWSVFLSFRPFFPLFPAPHAHLTTQNKKTPSRYYHFTHVYHKWNSYHVYMVPEIWSTKDRFFVILGHSLAFYPTNIQKNQNFEKIKKNIWRYHNFALVYYKWRSYDVWFWRYGVQQNNFSFWAIFCAFTPLKKQKQKLEKMKKHIQYHHFKHLYQKSWSKFLKNEKIPGEIIILD